MAQDLVTAVRTKVLDAEEDILSQKGRRARLQVGGAMEQELAEVGARADNMRDLQKNLMGLQMEWHQVAERQTGQVAQQRRLIKRLETMGAKRVFNEWQDGTEHMIQAALERTLNAVESELAELKREMTEKDARHVRLTEYARSRQEAVLCRTKNLPLARVFSPWRDYTRYMREVRAEQEHADLVAQVKDLGRTKDELTRASKAREERLQDELEKLRLQLQIGNKQRIRVVLQKLQKSRVWPAFNQWRTSVQEEVQRRLEEKAEAEAAHHQHMMEKAQALVQKMGVKAMQKMMNASLAAAFNAWRQNASEAAHARTMAAAVEEAVLSAAVPKDEKIAELKDEVEGLVATVQRLEQKLGNSTSRILKKMLNSHMSMAFNHWKALAHEAKSLGTIRSMVYNAREKAVRKMMNIGVLPAFLDWKRYTREAYRLHLEDELREVEKELRWWKSGAEKRAANARKTAERAARRIMNQALSQAFEHWSHITREERVLGNMRRVVEKARAQVIRRMMNMSLWRSFSQWKSSVRLLRHEKTRLEANLVKQDYTAVAQEAIKWQGVAQRAWRSLHQYISTRVINTMKGYRLRTFFNTWKDRVSQIITMRDLVAQVEDGKVEMKKMLNEVGHLRLFKDTVQRSEPWASKTYNIRMGGGYCTFSQWVDKAMRKTQRDITSGRSYKSQQKAMFYGVKAAIDDEKMYYTEMRDFLRGDRDLDVSALPAPKSVFLKDLKTDQMVEEARLSSLATDMRAVRKKNLMSSPRQARRAALSSGSDTDDADSEDDFTVRKPTRGGRRGAQKTRRLGSDSEEE